MKRFKLFALRGSPACGTGSRSNTGFRVMKKTMLLVLSLFSVLLAGGCDEVITNVDLEKPDKIIKNEVGILYYSGEHKLWAVERVYSHRAGAPFMYLLKNFENIALLSDPGTQVIISGKAYRSKLADSLYYIYNADLTPTGTIPTSIDQVVDICCLNYGEVKEWQYRGQTYKFSVTDLEDHLQSCQTAYFAPGGEDVIRMHVTLQVETDKGTIWLPVISAPCGLTFVENYSDEQNIAFVKTLLESNISVKAPTYFAQQFKTFGEGSLLEKPALSIYLAATYHLINQGLDHNDKNLYKFIFIITDQN